MKTTLIVLCLSLLAGCGKLSYLPKSIHNPIHNRVGEYQTEASLPSLQMPPGVTAIDPDPYYVVPDIPNAEMTSVSILPPGSQLMKEENTKPRNQRRD